MSDPHDVEAFIARWQDAGGSERANYQLFVADLCTERELHPALRERILADARPL